MTDETMEKGHAMRVSDCIQCRHFACKGVRHDRNVVPGIILRPEEITVFMVSEAAPPNTNDYYYAKGNPSFQEATVQAFNEAGWQVSSMKDILARGVYVTTAVKCAKTGYTIRPDTVRECSSLLERENWSSFRTSRWSC